MKELQRLTTEYIEAEDRLRVSGELAPNETVVMWLSQRLLRRLLPHLFLWLEQQSGDSIPLEIEQSFAQEAATADFAAETPVAQHGGSEEWLVTAVDLGSSEQAIQLAFRANELQEANLTLNSVTLRQWLSIVHNLWGNAEWPTEFWPEWIKYNSNTTSSNLRSSMH